LEFRHYKILVTGCAIALALCWVRSMVYVTVPVELPQQLERYTQLAGFGGAAAFAAQDLRFEPRRFSVAGFAPEQGAFDRGLLSLHLGTRFSMSGGRAPEARALAGRMAELYDVAPAASRLSVIALLFFLARVMHRPFGGYQPWTLTTSHLATCVMDSF
jgi:hypothetical protein